MPLDLHKAGLLPQQNLEVFDVVLVKVIDRLPLRRSRTATDSPLSPLTGADVVRELRAAHARGEIENDSYLVAEIDRCAVMGVDAALDRARKAPEGAVVLPVGSWLTQANEHFRYRSSSSRRASEEATPVH